LHHCNMRQGKAHAKLGGKLACRHVSSEPPLLPGFPSSSFQKAHMNVESAFTGSGTARNTQHATCKCNMQHHMQQLDLMKHWVGAAGRVEPVHFSGGTGGFHRRLPVGGAPKGTPRNTTTSSTCQTTNDVALTHHQTQQEAHRPPLGRARDRTRSAQSRKQAPQGRGWVDLEA
jgi:hypothetical protein